MAYVLNEDNIAVLLVNYGVLLVNYGISNVGAEMPTLNFQNA